MANPSVDKPRRGRLRRILGVLRWIILGFVVLSVAAYLLRGPLLARPLAGVVSGRLSEALGGRFSLDRVEGSWFTSLELVGLKTESEPADGPVRRLAFDRVRVEYGLFDFLGDRPLDAVRSVEARGVVVDLDLTRPAAPKETSEPATVEEVARLIPTRWPRLDVDVRARIRTAAGDVRVEPLTIGGEGEQLDVRATARLPEPFPSDEQSLHLRFERPGDDSLRLTSPESVLGLTVSRIEARAKTGNDFEASAELGFAGGTITVSAAPGDLVARVAGLGLAALPEWLRGLLPAAAPVPIAGRIDAELRSGSWLAAAPELTYSLLAEELAWPELSGGRVEIAGRARKDRILVSELDAALGDATARARDAVLDPARALPLVSVRTLTAALPDVRALAERLPGVSVGDVPWPGPAVAVTARLGGRLGDPITIEAIDVRCGGSAAHLSGKVLPADELVDWKQLDLELALDGRLPDVAELAGGWLDGRSAAGSVSFYGGLRGRLGEPVASLTLDGEGLALDGEPLGHAHADLTVRWPHLDVRALTLRGGVAELEAAGRIDVDDRTIEGARLDVAVAELHRLLPRFTTAVEAGGSVRVHGTLDKEASADWIDGYRGDLVVEGRELTVESRRVGSARLDVQVDGRTIEVPTLAVTGDVAEIRGRATIGLSGASPSVAASSLRVDVPDLAAVSAMFPQAPALAGSLKLSGACDKAADAPWREVTAGARLEVEAARIGGLAVDRLTAELTSRERAFTLRNVAAAGPWGSLETEGRAELAADGAGQAQLDRLAARLDRYPLTLLTPVEVRWTSDGEVTATDLQLDALGGEVRGHLTWGESVDASLAATRLDLAGLPKALALAGRASLELTASGPRERPRLDLRLSVPDLRWRELAGSVEARVKQDAAGIALDSLSIRAPASELTARGSLPFTIGSGGLGVRPWREARLDWTLRNTSPEPYRALGLPEALGWVSAGVAAKLEGGRLTFDTVVRDATWTVEARSYDLPAEIEAHADAGPATAQVSLAARGLEGLDVSGRVGLAAGLGEEPSAAMLDRILDAGLDGTLAARVPDLAKLQHLVPGLVRLAGRLDADLTLAGTARRPEPGGTLRVDGLAARLEGDLPGVDEGVVRAELRESRLVIEKVQALLGYSPVSVTGTVTLPRQDAPVALDLAIRGENTLVARNQHLRARADLDLKVSGPLDEILAAGRVRITDVLYSQPITLVGSSVPTADDRFQLFSMRRPPLSTMRFDLKIEADRTVRVENNLVDGDVSMDLTLRGTGAVPRPEGRVFFSDLRVKLPFSKLDIRRGDVVFDREQPFAPLLRINGETRMRGYDLFVDVVGRMPDQKVIVRSEPFLPQEDALFLLTVGATRAGLNEEGLSRAALTRVGSLLSDSLLAEIAGPTDPDAESLADRFSIEVGRDVSRSGQSTIDMEFRVLKQIYLRAQRDRYDDYNLGVVWRLRFR